MYGDAVGIRHFVKLIDTHDAAVSQHHGACLQPLLTWRTLTASVLQAQMAKV